MPSRLLARRGRLNARGQALVEYALLVAIIAVTGTIALVLLGQRVASVFYTIAARLGPPA